MAQARTTPPVSTKATISPCGYPLCPRAASFRGYCRIHQPVPHGGRGPYPARLRPNNRLFGRLRAAFLGRHPICADCQRAAATIVDHIVPHRGDGDRFWNQSNWQSLCKRCHDRKTRRGE